MSENSGHGIFTAQSDYLALVKGWEIRMGMGYLHTGHEMNKIWSDGFAWEMITIGYKPVKFFGFETGFILGFTGMQDSVKNNVRVYYPSNGDYGTQKSWGGVWGGIPLGGRFSWRLSHLPVVLTFGGGGIYCFEEELGINATGYDNRWTTGLGYYLLTSAHIASSNKKNPGSFGIQARYIGGYANVTDFNSSLGIFSEDKHFLKEGRLLITADMHVPIF